MPVFSDNYVIAGQNAARASSGGTLNRQRIECFKKRKK